MYEPTTIPILAPGSRLHSATVGGDRRITEKLERKFREVVGVTVEREESAKTLLKMGG